MRRYSIFNENYAEFLIKNLQNSRPYTEIQAYFTKLYHLQL